MANPKLKSYGPELPNLAGFPQDTGQLTNGSLCVVSDVLYKWDSGGTDHGPTQEFWQQEITQDDLATEVAVGVAEIATQVEVDAGTDDARIVTPLKLKNSVYASATGDNYVTAYDTTMQPVAVINTFQDITFDTNSLLNGWTHVAGTAIFTCAKSGRYIVTFECNVEKTGGGLVEVATRALFNAVEIAGSHAGMDLTANNTAFDINRTFIFTATTGQILKFQFAGNNVNGQITPAPAPGAPGALVSASLTIARLS